MNVDGAHKLARPVLAAYTGTLLTLATILAPQVPIEVLGLIAGPAITYITLKWKGNTVE